MRDMKEPRRKGGTSKALPDFPKIRAKGCKMKLQDFVSESLKQIMMGVTEAQEDPANTGTINAFGPGEGIFPRITEIEFDVAVSVTQEKGTKGGFGILVGPVGAGTKGQSQSRNTSVSRIKFSIPVRFPHPQKNRK